MIRRSEVSTRELADKLAQNSVVTKALARYLHQVLEHVDQTQIKPLESALRAILAEPFGCPFCDSGTLRNPAKGHDAACGFYMAQQLVGGVSS